MAAVTRSCFVPHGAGGSLFGSDTQRLWKRQERDESGRVTRASARQETQVCASFPWPLWQSPPLAAVSLGTPDSALRSLGNSTLCTVHLWSPDEVEPVPQPSVDT